VRENQDIFVVNKPGNPWLIFLHGFCESRVMWKPTVKRLGKEFNCFIPDLPGFGLASSERLSDLGSVASWVWEKASEKIKEPAHLIGHSMGGYIALEMAQDQGSLTRSISLVHSTASADDEVKKVNRDKGILFIQQHGLKPYLKEFKKNLLGHPNQPEFIQNAVAYIIEKGAIDPDGVIHALTSMKNRSDKMDFLSSSDIPVHYFIGKGDAFIPYRKLQIEALQGKRGSVTFMEDSTHIGFLEQSDLFYRHLKAFLRKT
jgi:pimeloyl-ACP methyl ester carboxylesterase